jgi:hypothetical protein
LTRANKDGIKLGKRSNEKWNIYIDPERVLELKSNGMSARTIFRLMECSVTPVLKY